MTDRDADLGSLLAGYLAGYATYPRAERRQQQGLGGVGRPRRNRALLTSAIAVIVALVIAVPVGITLILRSGNTNSTAGLAAGPQYIGNLHMFTPTTGWAWGGGSLILHTSVGVQEWNIVPPPLGAFHVIEVAWVDAQSARVLASAGSPDRVGTYQLVAWLTDDGGVTWTKGRPFTALDETAQDIYSASDVDFVDKTHGWFFDTQTGAEGSPIFIFRTVDGGLHWSQVETTPASGAAGRGAIPAECVMSGMAFLDATTGWVAGNCIGGGFLAVTHDGGSTWSQEPFACPEECTLNAPQFVSALDGVLVASVSRPFLFATTDGGRTWTQRADLPASSVQFINPNDGFSLGLTAGEHPPAVVFATHDGGRSWQAANPTGQGNDAPGPDSDIDQLDFVTATLGWAVPVDISSGLYTGTPTARPAPFSFWQTSDAGASWTLITPRFTRSVASRYGNVIGTLETVGGAAPGTPRPIPGSVVLRNAAGTVFTASAGANGAFSIRVPQGSYSVTATSPLLGGGGDCNAVVQPLVVAPGATVTTLVQCQIR
ncbi:MAG: YCF48-related protein [Candidatus Dormiibacterota bacterium]